MESRLIKLRNREEIMSERINEIVGEVKGDFFTNRNRQVRFFRMSDGFFSFSYEDILEIRSRLNQPNLFGFYFDVSVEPSTMNCSDDYLIVRRR